MGSSGVLAEGLYILIKSIFRNLPDDRDGHKSQILEQQQLIVAPVKSVNVIIAGWGGRRLNDKTEILNYFSETVIFRFPIQLFMCL